MPKTIEEECFQEPTSLRKCLTVGIQFIQTMYNEGEVIPELESIVSNGIAWDWMKPCYHSTLTYNCIIENENE